MLEIHRWLTFVRQQTMPSITSQRLGAARGCLQFDILDLTVNLLLITVTTVAF